MILFLFICQKQRMHANEKRWVENRREIRNLVVFNYLY